MSQLRKEPVTGRWILINITNPRRPEEYELSPQTKKGGKCPFCPGNEKMTPPEIEAIRNPDTGHDTTGWSVRVVPNKFPALRIEGEINKRGVGLYDMSNGIGAHEVIIETPDHSRDLGDLSEDEMRNVLFKYRSRSLDLEKDPRFRYILIFKNHGQKAGASLEHTHTQLVALPIVPKRVIEELKGAQYYFNYKERCVFCDMIANEKQENIRMICENDSFVSFCPFVPRFPYEIWILPKTHNQHFKSIDDKRVGHLASILKDALLRLKRLLNDPSYNFIIHTSPVRDGHNEEYHWHLEIMPKLTQVAGFEWGSGFYINPTSPEFAAEVLRNVQL